MQEAWLAEGISLTFYRADISLKKTPIFWHFVCHNCCEKTCDVFGSDSNISKNAVSLTKKQNCTVGINSYNGCQT